MSQEPSQTARIDAAQVTTDGGETFGQVTAIEDFTDPSVNGSVIALQHSPGTLLASHCDDPDLRRNLTVSRSDDDGATWRPIHRAEPGSAAYSQLAELPDGTVAVAYEADGYQDIRIALLDPTGTPPPGTAEITSAPGWSRTTGEGGVEVDLLLRSIVPARPQQWVEAGPTHTIDLTAYADVDPSVFKEIGQDRAGDAVQVLRTRESLDANLGPVRPGIHAGDELEIHARIRNRGDRTATVTWDGELRSLSPGESWVRRDLRYRITAEDVESGTAAISIEPSVGGRSLVATLRVPTTPDPQGCTAR